ncbi:LysR family transcriptional regulator [Cypionkella psychrotolerans]|uniref:LysR family transcriptional regulator n=1 Tax=Cypionkella psychrotolerans TaxID=1678131 RepID=UPI0006B67C79|nr:LysR family transcriptional regulator [Cypionkella psychrotolerans]
MLSNLTEGDIRLLKVFAKVVEAGGFSAAQIDLNISQSTISTHMTSLEQRLGVRLCERGRSGFRLTERGQLIYQASQRLFMALDEFRSDAGAARNCLTGNLAIGMLDSLITNPVCCLHQAIAAFHHKAPEVQCSIRVTSPSEIERMVLEGSCDMGLGACGQHSPYLEYEDIFEERQALYCGHGHPLFAPDHEIGIADLKDQQFVRRAYAAPEKLPPGIKLASTAVADLMESVAAFILSGVYIGFLPVHVAQHWVALDQMRPILEPTLGYQNPVYLVTRKTEEKKPVLSVFLKELRLAHGQQPAQKHAAKRMVGRPRAVG